MFNGQLFKLSKFMSWPQMPEKKTTWMYANHEVNSFENNNLMIQSVCLCFYYKTDVSLFCLLISLFYNLWTQWRLDNGNNCSWNFYSIVNIFKNASKIFSFVITLFFSIVRVWLQVQVRGGKCTPFYLSL